MINDQPYTIEYFVVYHNDTGKEYEIPDYAGAKTFCDFYNEEEYKPWTIYAKIKDTTTTLPRKS